MAAGVFTKQYLSNAAGKKVYSNGSHAPTRGTVNPRGYIKRQVRKSNRRSGLARAALRRVQRHKKHKMVVRKKTGPKPPPIKKAVPIRRPGSVPKPVLKQPPVKPVTHPPTTPAAAGPPPAPPPEQQPANPYIQINSNGQLDLPYNADYSWEVLNGVQGMNQQLLDLQQQQQQESNDYISQGRNLDQGYGYQQNEVLDRDAGRGMAFTSIHGDHVARAATDYNNQRTDLDTGHNTFLQNLQMQRTGIQNNFNDMLRQNALKNAEAQAANAGTLGYGTGTAAPMPIPNRAPKPVPKPGPRKPAPKPKPHKVKKKAHKPKPKPKKSTFVKAAQKKIKANGTRPYAPKKKAPAPKTKPRPAVPKSRIR